MRRLWDDMAGGLLCALLSLAYAFSFGALIFNGPLRPWLAEGIAASLVTAAVGSVLVAFTSRMKGAIAGPESSTVAFIAAMTAGMAPALATVEYGAFEVAIVAITGSALVSGALLVIIGRLRLGRYVRFVPYPVLAGFMASVGWSISFGALQLGGDTKLGLHLFDYANRHTLFLICLTVAAGAFIWIAAARLKSPLTQPLALLSLIGLAHLGLTLLHLDAFQARALGVLFPTSGSILPVMPFMDGSLNTLDWWLFKYALWYIPAIALMTTLSVLLNTTGIEAATRSEVDLDHELQSNGFSNIVSASLGGYVGYVSISRTLLNHNVGGRGPLAGVVVAIICTAAIFVGSEMLSVVPRFVLGGLLFSVGARLLWDWTIARGGALPTRDRAIVLGIVIVSALSSMLYGILAGLVAGCLIFAIDVSRMQNVRRRSGLDERPSSLLRSAEEMSALAEEGRRVMVLELENHLFFGSAHRLYEEVSVDLSRAGLQEVIIDFAQVRGIDSSGAAIFSKIADKARQAGCALTLTGCSARERQLLAAVGGIGATFHDTLDLALEAAENRLLATTMSAAGRKGALRDWMSSALGEAAAKPLLDLLTPRRLAVGGYLCRQGEPTETLLFIESGRVSVLVGTDSEKLQKVRAFNAHTIVGEIGFFTGAPRTATLLIEQDALVWSLDQADFATLQKQHPASAAALYDYVIRILSERLAFATRQATAALR